MDRGGLASTLTRAVTLALPVGHRDGVAGSAREARRDLSLEGRGGKTLRPLPSRERAGVRVGSPLTLT